MQVKKKILLLFATILFLVSFVHSATEADFVKVLDSKTAIEYYTQKTMEKSDLVIGTDKIIYASHEGEVLVHIYVKGKAALVSKIGIEGTKAALAVKDFGGAKEGIIQKTTKSIDITKAITISGDLQEFTLTLTFDPNKVGLRDEFDIVLYGLLGNEIARLDPFLSGWNRSANANILGATATDNYVLRVDFNATASSKITDFNANFWNNINADCNDVRFTNSAVTVVYPMQIISCIGGNRAIFDVNFGSITTGTNDFKLFWDNGSAPSISSPLVTTTRIDGFEDGDYNANPAWTVRGDQTTTVDAAVYKNGAKSVKIVNGNNDWGGINIPVVSTTTNYSLWMYSPDVSKDAYFRNQITAFASTGFECGWVDGNFYTNGSIGGNVPANSTWYHFVLKQDNATGVYDVNIFNSAEALINSHSDAAGAAIVPVYFEITTRENGTVYYDDILVGTFAQYDYNFGGYNTTSGVSADFNYALSPSYLDAENGINSVTATFIDLSTFTSTTPASWKWYSDSVLFSTDQNTTKAYTTAADYNVCLDVNAVDANAVSYGSIDCQTVTVPQTAQSLAIGYDINAYSTSDVNILFKGTAAGSVDNWYWQYDGTYFGTLQNSNKVFTGGDADANICVTAFLDVNKIYCKNYYVSEIMVKKPIKESDGTTTITPFGLLVNSTPTQSYSALVADTNFFNFSPSIINYNLTIDANDSLYFDRVYAFSTSTANYTLQPYLADASTGTSIKIVTLSSVDQSTIGRVSVLIYKNLPAGRILVESVVTDDKGEAFTSGIINNAYEYEVYYNGLFIDLFNITVTSTTIYIRFNPSISSSLPASVTATIGFTPNSSALIDFNSSTTFKQTFTYTGSTAASIRIWAKQIDVNGIVPDANLYSTFITVGITSPYTNTITASTQLTGWDENLSLWIYATLCFTDGNCYTRMQKYYAPYSASGTTWDLLTRGVWTTLGCSGEVCPFLMLLSLLISISVVSWLAVTNPLPEVGNHLGIVFIIVLGIFVVINWLHWALWLAAALATFFISTVSREAVK